MVGGDNPNEDSKEQGTQFLLENSPGPTESLKRVLKLGKYKSKSLATDVDQSTLSIDVDEEVFCLGYIPLNIFEKKLRDAKKKAKHSKTKLTKIDLSRNGYITDAAIKSLVNILGKKTLSRITKISLEGCSFITDIGLHTFVQGLSDNRCSYQVNINGCSSVTDGGLATLANAPNIGYIEAMATSVSHLCQIASTQGCPLLLNPKLKTVTKKEAFVIIVPMATEYSLSEFLQTKTAKQRRSFHYLNNMDVLNWSVNVAELERDHVLFEHMLPPNPLHVIIPFAVSCDVQQLKEQIIDTVAHVLSKEYVNPIHGTHGKIIGQSSCFMSGSTWKNCSFSQDGILRNISDSLNVAKVQSYTQMSRTNSYFEVQCISCQPETNLIMGIMLDILITDKESDELVTKGFELEAGVVYGFGIRGNWESEYVLSGDVICYFTKNGFEILKKQVQAKSLLHMLPVVCVQGKGSAAVKILSQACPPKALIKQWKKKEQFWTPTCMNNIQCDDRGILSYVSSKENDAFVLTYKDDYEEIGLMLCKEEVTKQHNSFSIQVLEMLSGTITVGLGSEDYSYGLQPGWDMMSLTLHGDDGKIFVETGHGVTPNSDICQIRKNKDVIKTVVNMFGESYTIQPNDKIQVDFYVNTHLVATVTHKMAGSTKGNRFMFMVGMKGTPTQAKILNYRPTFLPEPPRMDMLTMGCSHLLNIYDDGSLVCRELKNDKLIAQFMSKTPFNTKLTYFELKVNSLNEYSQSCIGFAYRECPFNRLLGSFPGSVGYRAHCGQLYSNGVEWAGDRKDKPVPTYGNGDIVGCGFDINSAKFREDGSLENQQMLRFYFCKNGVKVHEVDFEYLSDGIYPGVNLDCKGDKVSLFNYHPGPANQAQLAQKRKEKVASEPEEKFVEGCRFTLVSVGDHQSDPQEKLQTLQDVLKEGLEFPMLSVIDKKIKEMESDPKVMNLQGQQLYGQLHWQMESLERFLANSCRLRFMSVDVSTGQGHKELVEHIAQVAEMDLMSHTKFYDLTECVCDGLEKIKNALTTENLMTANQIINLVSPDLGQNGKVLEAGVHYLKAKGHLLTLPYKRTYIALDIRFAETLISMLEAPSNVLSGKTVPCIGEKIHIWNQITDILPDISQIYQAEFLDPVLQFLGVLKLSCLRTIKSDPMFSYCKHSALREHLVHLPHFIEKSGKDTVLIQREYQFLYKSTRNILSTIISKCILFFRPLAISQDWSVFQSGAAQTVIYFNEDNGLKVETRCFMPSQMGDNINGDTQYHVEEYAFNIFCIFIDIIDNILAVLKIRAIYTEQVPPNLVNSSVGCIHQWSLSDQTYRQTVCTLCGQCCDKGQSCPYSGLTREYQHQCGCKTQATGCKDCGICQSCADQLWSIRSYLRPNLEVASYNEMKNSQLIPLNTTTYDEVEFTNLGTRQAPICLQMSTDQYTTSAATDDSASLTKMFPGMATMFPNQQLLQEHLQQLSQNSNSSKLMSLEQGDTITIKLDPIKRDAQKLAVVEEESQLEITPVYFTSICRNTRVWHETGIVAYTSLSSDIPVGQFISASPLTPECSAFSFQILNSGNSCRITIGVCHKRYPPDCQPGWMQGSLAYHADDGCIYTGPENAPRPFMRCFPGDTMKCQLNFEQQSVSFYKNGKLVYEAKKIRNFGNYHAAVGLHSLREAVRLLEREPWEMTDDGEPTLPDAFDSYSYGNMEISPRKTLNLMKCNEELTAWLMINNPSKSPVGYKISSPLVAELVGYLKPSKSAAFRLQANPTQDSRYKHGDDLCVDIHWFLLESNYDYSNKDMGKIYLTTTPESLMKHQLRVKITEVQTKDPQPLKLASEEPGDNDHYLAEVFKNGISVQKYWLKEGNYVCCLPQECSILVRYPKFPTLCLPNGFQKGMRVVLDLTNTEKDLYAEALIEAASPEGDLRLMYSEPGKAVNTVMEVNVESLEIALKEHVPKPATDTVSSDVSGADKLSNTECKIEQVADLSLIGFQPRGNIAATKRAYTFPPFHLLTEASQAAIISLDIAWKTNTLNSVAQCKTLPTRLTVQELQISKLVGSSLDWLTGANQSQKFDLAFTFLPVKLGYIDLCFPRVPSMFTEVSVHRLCFLVDQMYYMMRLTKNYNLMLDAPLHFVNMAPAPADPALSTDVMFASSFNAWVYSTLYSNKLHLPLCDNIFPEGKPDFSRDELEQLMKSLIHVYAAQCHIFAEQYGGIMYQKSNENGTQIISSSIEHMESLSVRKTDEAELSSDILIGKKFRNNMYCKAHQWCLSGANIVMEKEFDFRSELFQPYEETINFMYRDMPNVTLVRPDLYSLFRNLQYLKLQSCHKMKDLPDGISKCLRLEMVSLKNSAFEVLPADLFQTPCLQKLHCVDLRVKALPTSIMDSSPITELTLSNLLLTSIPKELGNLSNLELLNLNSNPLEMLPMELQSLTKLKTLYLCGIPWIVMAGSKVEMPLDQFDDFLKTNSSLKHFIGKKELVALFHKYDHNKNSRLDENEIVAFNAHLFWKVPRLGASCIKCTEYGGIPPVIFLLRSLESLHLDFQAITSVPAHICRLHNLKVLSISNNPLLESLPGSLGHLPSLKSIRLMSNPSLRTPPHEVVSRGFIAVKAYLKRLAGGFTECRRTKLMLVGLGGAGKTSLLRALMSSNKKTTGTKGEDITNGIDIHTWKLRTSDNVEVTYNTWDFAGQTLYYNTHQFFLSKRAVYLLLWSTRQGFEHAGLEFWLSSIASHAPKTPIFVVGTHCDQVPTADIPTSDLQQRYPQIAGFHFVSSVEGIGIAKLEEDLLKVTLELKNMGEKVPQVWLNMEKKILVARSKNSILPWKVIKDFGTEVGIFDEKDIREAIQFLHELGAVQYFDNDFLRDQVVINPQWIVNVMSCLVSVKNSPIKENDGRFYHKHIPDIWKSYPPELHKWLLSLTEEFDLTFPLPDEEINIVPCLLPQKVPANFDWPVADAAQNLKETRYIYHFTYLPAGLFNRLQVRLFQFSDGKMIWKRGSLLKKNKHQALILQISDSELQVKVQGPKPENVVFLIHEIIESLIHESFHGVVYEFLVPCPDCVNREGTLEPYMFEGSFVRRAREHKAPFLQCKKYFHTISMAQLYEVMPSSSVSDIDVQLQNSLTIMQQLNETMSTDVAIVYSARDNNSDVSPAQIKKDLEKAGLKCWYSNAMDTVSVQDIMLALKNCKVVVALLSDNFEKDERTRNLLLYTMDNLVKDIIIVVIRDSLEWENTDLGMRIGKQEEKIMIKNKGRYEVRIGDMIKAVRSKLQQTRQQIQSSPSVFFSYCWSNSKDAQSKGTTCPANAVGWADPREIKQQLEKRGLSCWIDIDQPVAGKGLFGKIAEGISNSKVLVAFVSNEYEKADNCMMELRFAILNINLPVIVAAVGTGVEWKQSEIGMLMQRSRAAKVNFQKENSKSLDKLEALIRQSLPNDTDNNASLIVRQTIKTFQKAEETKSQKDVNEIDANKYVFQEEFELMQRKFMRHIITFVSSMDSVPTPHLIVVDFEKHALLSRNEETILNATNETENQIKHQKVRNSFRPSSGIRSSRNVQVASGNAENRWENETFCLKILCEDEKGWHVCDKFFTVKMNDEFKNIVKGCSAYLARMYAILRQSAVTLNCFDGPVGSGFTSWIEQNAPDNINFIDSYTALRIKLAEDDKAKEFLNQLCRCHMPTGKIYWLCEKHSSGPRITHLSTEVATRSEIGQVQYEEDIKLKEKLEHSETYKERKKAKSPSSGIVLPIILDALPRDTLVSKDSLANYATFIPQNPSDLTKGKSEVPSVAEVTMSKPRERYLKSKTCNIH